MGEYNKDNLQWVLRKLSSAISRKHDEVSVETTYHRTDPDHVNGLKIGYRGKQAVEVVKSWGTQMKVRSWYEERYSSTTYDANELYSDKKVYNRLLNAVKRKLKVAVKNVDKSLLENEKYEQRTNTLLQSLLKQGFSEKQVKGSSYGSVDVCYNGENYDCWSETGVKIQVPADKLKAVLDLIAK